MPFLIPIGIAAGSAALGRALSNRSKTTTQTGSTDSTTTPVLAPEWGGLKDLLIQYNMDKLMKPTPIAGYEASGLDTINKTFGAAEQNRQNTLTSRGLLGSNLDYLGNEDLNSARAGQQATWLNQMPMLERQMQGEDLATAMKMFSMAPYGQTGTGTSAGQYTMPGNVAGGLFSGMGDLLAYLIGKGAFGKSAGKD